MEEIERLLHDNKYTDSERNKIIEITCKHLGWSYDAKSNSFFPEIRVIDPFKEFLRRYRE